MSDATLARIGLLRRRFGVAIAPVLSVHIRSIQASLQDRALKLVEGCSVGHAQIPSVPCSGTNGSKLGRVASAMAAHQEVEPDKSPV